MGTDKLINPYRLFHGSMLPNWLLQRTELSPGGKLVYGRLTQYAGGNGVAWPSQGSIADEVGIPVRSVRRYLAELKEAKLIKIEQESGRTPRVYFLAHEWMKSDPSYVELNVATQSVPQGATPAKLATPPAKLATPPGQIGRGTLYTVESLKRIKEGNGALRAPRRQSVALNPPSQDEVCQYFGEIGSASYAEEFYDHFTSNGWKVGGKTQMLDWKAAARNWKRRQPHFRKAGGNEGERERFLMGTK